MSDDFTCYRCDLPLSATDAMYLADQGYVHHPTRCVVLLRSELSTRDEQIAALKKDAQIELVFKASRDKLLTVVTAERDAARRELQHLYCRSARDGECIWEYCPQLRDGEPAATGRHCPLDTDSSQGAVE